ncbi:hypothetical protein PsorP6_000111 [Peronosclerospora sorghi]|uniref:Uncharacterized protein n=1 Tax=Peronosclerospora sorghi TaxID=230839 RepID=A0ACC0WUF8_9STRA|nr:hypothetical protein PsorP6_000111 [Peronosclerospora sorghi]
MWFTLFSALGFCSVTREIVAGAIKRIEFLDQHIFARYATMQHKHTVINERGKWEIMKAIAEKDMTRVEELEQINNDGNLHTAVASIDKVSVKKIRIGFGRIYFIGTRQELKVPLYSLTVTLTRYKFGMFVLVSILNPSTRICLHFLRQGKFPTIFHRKELLVNGEREISEPFFSDWR